MTYKRRFLMAIIFALMLTVFVTTSAFADYCTNAKKKEGAGSIGTFNVVTGTFEPNKQLQGAMGNGGFITFTDGTTSVDILIHHTLPEGALASGPAGDNQCDGVGIDNVAACFSSGGG